MGCMGNFGDEFDICPHCGYVVGTPAEEAIHMEPGTILHDRYIIGRVLGYGGFGVTYIAWDGKLEQRVAVKEFLPGEFSTRMPGQTMITVFNGDKSEQFRDGLNKFVDEAKRLAKFQNEAGIVKVFDSFEENATAYIIMEYLEGETLTDYLKRNETIEPEKAISMLMPIMESLQTVHESGILHRDIAPDNVFLTTNGEVKLIDFGASRYATTSHSRSLTVIIKPGYSPEEQYRSRSDQGPYTDVYSVAATLYKMITGKTPPDAMERRAKYENDNKDILTAPHKLTKKITPGIDVALLNALNVRIEDRTQNIPEFIKELNADPPAKRKYGKIKKIDVYMWPLWLKILAPSLLGIFVVFSTLLLTNVIKFSNFTDKIVIPDNIVIVPDVEGILSSDALKLIEEGKLLAQTSGTVESEYITAGKIVLQDPVGGSFKDINSVVKLTVSSGTEVQEAVNGKSIVPFVTWDTKEDAISKFKIAGLGTPVIEEQNDENVEAGHVISQSIEPLTEVDEGTIVTLVISLGPPAFELPDVKNKKLDEAQKILTDLGLSVSIEYGNDDKIEKGNIISQDIKPGTDVRRGDAVTIVVSSGKETFEVINVENTNKNDAADKLREQGFNVKILENYDENIEEGKVISQNPKAGSHQIKGTEIVLIVSKGTQQVTVNLCYQNGDSDSVLNTRFKKNYGPLPTPSKRGHTFLGWYTASEGGKQINSDSIVETQDSHSLYAQWRVNEYTLTVDYGDSRETVKLQYGQTYQLNHPEKLDWYCTGWYTNGNALITYGKNDSGSYTYKFDSESDQTVKAEWERWDYEIVYYDDFLSTMSRTKIYNGDRYSNFPDTRKDYYTFRGWYTEQNGNGTRVDGNSVFDMHRDSELYGFWTENPESDWVEEGKLPAGTKVTATKWTYTKTTTNPGWDKVDSGTHTFANYPSGFDTNNYWYNQYGKSKMVNSGDDTEKIEVSNPEHHTYIYWHWNYTLAEKCSLNDRKISDHYNEFLTGGGHATHFAANERNENLGHTDKNGKTVDAFFWDTGTPDDVSWWWFQLEVYKQNWTKYKYNTHEKKEELESSKEVKNGGEISNVKKWVKYREK